MFKFNFYIIISLFSVLFYKTVELVSLHLR
jgi:hypothetical protein